MNKRTLIVGAIGAAMALAPAATASADPGPPCHSHGGPGHSDYARHHIVPATPGHVPGTHRGYSLCLGVHD